MLQKRRQGFMIVFSFPVQPSFNHHKRFKKWNRFLAALAFLLLSVHLFGQSSFTWYFGNHAGIKFNTNGTTVPMTGSNMNTTEGCTVTSDTAGVIMFYSDGVSVWNNSSATPVCATLLGSTSSTQAALALALPGTNCQRFLIFTTKGLETGGNHDLGVALVNVTGTSPNYVVSVSEPALSVIQPAGTVVFAEKLAATSDTAGGYWVVAHNYIEGSGTANTFYKYHITAAGFSTVTTTAQAQAALNLVQQTQSIGSNHHDLSTPDYNAQGQMKFSKAGQKLALVLAGSKIIDLFSFDLLTGNLTAIASTTVNPSTGNLYGCELSPLGNKLYASEGFAQSGTTIRKIFQYDISGGTLSSPYTVASGSNQYSNRYKYNALQLGPNDKIYCSEEMGISFLSVIQFPNNTGSACGWSSMTEPIANTNALGLSTVMSNSGCICLPSPGAVSGPSGVCRGAVGKVYSVMAVPGATGYTWSLPAGVIVTSGNNTNAITVTFTGAAVSGSIRASAYNAYCTGVTSPPFAVTVSSPAVIDLGPDQTICQGQSVTFNAGACTGCTYLWLNLTTGQPNIGTGQTYTTGVAGIYKVAVTEPVGCIGYDTVQLFVQTAVPVSINITASENPVCAGTQVTFSAIAQPGGTNIAYTWKVNGVVVSGGTNPVYTYVPSDGDCIVCVYSTNLPCASGNPATSNPVCITVNQNLPVSVTITASANQVCAGNEVTFTAFPVNPGGSPLYQWYVNSIPSGGNSNIFTHVPANGDCITCSLSSSSSCTTGNPAMSNQVCIMVNPNLPVSVTITASANQICSGTEVTFTAFPVNPGALPLYQWYVNSVPSGGNSNIFMYVPANGDVVTCRLTSSETCTLANPVTSAPVTMTVNPLLPVSITIVASSNPFCDGSAVTFSATPVNGGTGPGYQWYVNGIAEGANQGLYVRIPADGEMISCVLTSNLACITANLATSPAIVMIEHPAPVVTFTPCFDTVTISSARPYQLKGGLPSGGQFAGLGVNSSTGEFSPSDAGTGLKTITYSYSNVYGCSNSKARTILVIPPSAFTCGNQLADIRDNKVYTTALIGNQCWMGENLNYGSQISYLIPQTDNCQAERYTRTSSSGIVTSFYQWDELMNYMTTSGSRGLCPPGWHLPTLAEWDILLNQFFGQGMAGGWLKDKWLVNGFDSHQLGLSYQNNTWAYSSGIYAGSMYWTSVNIDANRAAARGINDYNPSVSRYDAAKSDAFNVRCIQD